MFKFDPEIHAELIAQGTLKNVADITYAARMEDYRTIKMLRPDGKLGWASMRRWNDIMAATYAHSLAIDQKKGDDCMDWRGSTLECKLALINSTNFWIGPNGGLNFGSRKNPSSLLSSANAVFRVYGGTSKGHHNKDTAFVLYSEDHKAFISGFMMPGEKVEALLHEGKTTNQRTISLSQFIEHGYEFGSMVPNMGWERFETALRRYTLAMDGHLDRDDTAQAMRDWFALANLDNLKTL